MFSGPATIIPLSHHPPQTEFWERAGLVITSRGPGSRRSRHEGFGYQVDSTSGYREVPISGFLAHSDLHLFQRFLYEKHWKCWHPALIWRDLKCPMFYIVQHKHWEKILYAATSPEVLKQDFTAAFVALIPMEQQPSSQKYTIRLGEWRPHHNRQQCHTCWHLKACSKKKVRRSIFYGLVLPRAQEWAGSPIETNAQPVSFSW